MGVDYKWAVSILYTASAIQTFFLNRRWSFQYNGNAQWAFIRYLLAYAFGYLLNIFMLIVLVDVAGFPHQLAQGAMIPIIAVLLFLLQKFWVFERTRKTKSHLQ
jgi:putative flippase GtrA